MVAALAALPAGVVVVLDDLQHLRDSRVLATVQLLQDHRPPGVRLILSTRYDPPLRLRRLAVAGVVSEIRARDLAFDDAEAAEMFTVNGRPLPAAAVTALLDRTRGWAAGLRLAVIALDRADPQAAVTRLRGSDRPVAEYLMQEVLDQLSDRDRRFLLRTSVADPITADLADLLSGDTDGQGRLDRLETHNGFITALTGDRTRYSWHPLFRELLSYRLTVEQPGEAAGLHRAAARWFVDHGDHAAAIRQLTDAADWAAIGAVLADRAAPDLLATPDPAPALLDALTAAAAHSRFDPTSGTLLASALCNLRSLDYDAMLRDARAAEAAAGDDPSAAPGVDVLVATLRMTHARARQPDQLTRTAGRVLSIADQLSRHRIPALERYRAIATAALGVGQLWDGDLAAAHSTLAAAEQSCTRWELTGSARSARGHLAVLAALHGDYPAARRLAEPTRPITDRHPRTGDAHRLALAMTALDTGHPDDADQLISTTTPNPEPDPASQVAFAILAVRLALTRLDALAAARAAHTLTELLTRTPPPPLLADWAGIVLADHELGRGRPNLARDLLAPAPGTGYTAALHEITLAACLLAQDDPAAALHQLTETITHDPRFLALTHLSAAIDLAAAPGITRPFLVAGDQIRPLLDRHRTLHHGQHRFTAALHPPAQGPAQARRSSPLEPLTEREQMVLRYLPTHYKAAEIGADLFLSVNTVKSHMRAIYRKLAAGSRHDAVTVARAHGLL